MAKKKKKTKKKAAKKTARKGKARKKAASNREVLVVGSKIKAYVKSKGYMSSSELLPAVSDAVYAILDRAVERAEGNKRSTLRARDL